MKTMKWAMIAGLVTGLSLTGMAQNFKVAVIDLDRAFEDYYKTDLAKTQLEEQAKDFTSERKTLIEEYEALQVTFNEARDEAQNAALSDEVRDAKRNEAEAKLLELREYENKIQRFDKSRKKTLGDQTKRMRSRIVEEIQEQIETYAVNLGFSMVIDYSGESMNGVPVIMYADDRIDITDEVIELINRGKGTDSDEE